MGCRAFALLGCCVAPLVFRAPEGPAAREARRPHFVRRRASKPARALRSLRRPSHRRRLWFWCARPGPAAAHRHRGQDLRTLRRPPHQWGWVAVNSPARPRCRPPALRPGPPDPPAPSTPAALALRGVAWRVGSKPGQALPSLLAPRVKPSRPSMLSPRPISHVIPLRLFQILNSDRWNCNVFGLC